MEILKKNTQPDDHTRLVFLVHVSVSFALITLIIPTLERDSRSMNRRPTHKSRSTSVLLLLFLGGDRLRECQRELTL